MFIETEKTPNPETLKFMPGKPLLAGKTAEFTDEDEAERYSPLAFRLLTLGGIKHVFIASDFVSVTKDDTWDWSVLKPTILTALLQHFTFDEPVVYDSFFERQDKDKAPRKDMSAQDAEIVDQIQALLDERVRPAVAQDGGDIEFDDFRDGVLYLRMRGACAGCPSSTMTLKAGIENMMKHYIPEVQEVRESL